MKPFIHVLLATGHLYEIPTAAIAHDRAAYYHREHAEEFPTMESALEDTQALFEDNFQVKDWALNQMNVPELLQPARLVRYTPPEPDFQAAEWSYHDAPAMIPQLDASQVLGMPVEMALAAMAAHRNVCQLVTINDVSGEPGALFALVQGPSGLIGTYVGALQHLTSALLRPQAPQPANEAPAVDPVLQHEQPGKMQ